MKSRVWSRAVVGTALALVVAGCGMRLPFGASGSGSGGPFFSTKLCGVKLEGVPRAARLHLSLNVVRALPKGALVESEFQDSADRSVHTVSRVASGSERTIELLSPPIGELRARGYETVTRVYASAERKEVLGSHTHVCESLLDQRDLGSQFR
ncbi:MAG TPA: hypothetical protein VD867_14600 [Burkholderiales bacterium]|nr:hypothetical protein [Burkholderiales bacterium]